MSQLKIYRLERKIRKIESKLESLTIMHDLELEQLNKNWLIKFDMIVGMFEVQANEAGTISELRKWFKDWSDDVNSINASDDNSGEQIANIINKHGFEFNATPINITYREMLNK